MTPRHDAIVHLGAATCSLVMTITMIGTGYIMTAGHMTPDDRFALAFAAPVTAIMVGSYLVSSIINFQEAR